MKLIPIKEREGKTCHYCGTDKSVKYTLTNCDSKDDIKLEVCCCNKCVARYGEQNIFK